MSTKRIGDVSKSLGVSSQTIRNYLKLGDQYFSETASRQTGKRFTAEDVVTLRAIKSHLDNGLMYEDIPERLTPAVRVIDDGQSEPGYQQEPSKDTPEPTTDLAPRYEQTIAAQQQTIILQNDYIEHLKSENERLHNELDNVRLPWFRRWFGNSQK